jgi:hypothetical protein
MKSVKPLIGLILILSCFHANAQKGTAISYAPSTDTFAEHGRVTLYDPYKINDNTSSTLADAPGQRMIRVGKGLTIGGGVLLVGGIILMATADEIYYTQTTGPYGTEEEGDPQGALGLVMAIGGVGMIIPGAIVWSKGKKKYNAYKANQGQASLSIGVNQNGAGLRFRF